MCDRLAPSKLDVRAIYEIVAGVDQRMRMANGKLMQQRTWIDRLDQRVYAQDDRFDALDKRLDALDKRLDALDKRLDALDQKLAEVLDLLRGHSGDHDESS